MLDDKIFESSSVAFFYENKLLLLKRSKTAPWMPLHYCLVGGKIEKGETSKEAAVRETMEEIGVDVKPNQLTKIRTIVKSNSISHIYAIKLDCKPKVKLNFEHNDYIWCDYKKCKNLKLIPNLNSIINNLKNKSYFE